MSTSEFFELPETVQRLHEGPLAAHIDAYASRLLEQGFSSGRARDRSGLLPISVAGSSEGSWAPRKSPHRSSIVI